MTKIEKLEKIIPGMIKNIQYELNDGLTEDEVVQHFLDFYDNDVQNFKRSIEDMDRTGMKPSDSIGTFDEVRAFYTQRMERAAGIAKDIQALIDEGSKPETEASLKPVLTHLESVYSKLNEKYFDGKLEKPVIAISPDTTKVGAYGWCTSWKAWTDGSGAGYYEINICSDHLHRPMVELVGTLLHEMVHLENLMLDIQDTSRGGTYHNKKFKAAAEKRGLSVDQDSKYGWCRTTLLPETEAFVKTMVTEENTLRRISALQVNGMKAKKKSSTRKYVCPACGTSVRATKDVNILCGDCMKPMAKEGDDEEEEGDEE